MADNSQPKLIRPPLPPYIECRCGSKVDIMPFDMKMGKIPRHDPWNIPGQECSASGTPLKGIHIHNL